MNQPSSAANFEDIAIPSKDIPYEGKRYRVYKNEREFILVNAASALEAIRNSGIQNIYKLDLESLDKMRVMDPAKSAEVLLGIKPEVAAPAPVADPSTANPA